MAKKKHRKLNIIIILLIAFGLFYVWGTFYYQRDRQIDRIVSALNDPKQSIAEYVSTNNPDMEISNQKLKPLQNYFAQNKNASKQLSKNLREGKNTKQLAIKETGSHFFIFPKYTLRVPVFHPQVATNHADSTLIVDKKKFGKMKGADQNYYQDLSYVFPGRYHLKVMTQVAGRKLKADSIVNIWSDKTINMIIKTGTFQIRSVPNGVVYINDQKIKTLDKYGQATFKNYPLAKNMELFIKAKYNGKTIQSEKVKDLSSAIDSDFSNSDDNVTDYGNPESYAGNLEKDVYQDVEGDYVVNPLWTGLIKEDQAGHIIYNSYLKPSKDLFEQEKDYKTTKKWVDNFKKNKKQLKLEVKIKNIMPAGDYYSEVSYELHYKWKDGSKQKEKVLKFNKAIFHEVQGKQLVQTLGKQAK